MKGIADTGFLVAFVSLNDRHHVWAADIARQWTEPFLTCESVLSETAFNLRSSSAVFEMLTQGLVTLAFNCSDHLLQLEQLARQYADRKPDFADLCLIRMSELFPRHPIITVDREDFRIYRRNKRDMIPLICPPGRFMPNPKGKLFLFHWEKAGATARAAALTADGWQVEMEFEGGSRGCKNLKAFGPDVVVFDIAQKAVHSRECGRALRNAKALRETPFIFVDGTDEEIAKVKAKVPKAIFAGSKGLTATLASFDK